MQGLLVGTWIRCGETSVFLPVADGEVGLEFTADGRFFRVYEGPGGTLIRSLGLEQEGRWTVIEGGQQVNLQLLGLGTSMTRRRCSRPPTCVRWTGAPPVPGVLPEPGQQPYRVAGLGVALFVVGLALAGLARLGRRCSPASTTTKR